MASRSSTSSVGVPLESSHPALSTLGLLDTATRTRVPRYTKDELSRKKIMKRQRGSRFCVVCGFWKAGAGFVRSLAMLGSPRFELRMFRTCNQCSRRKKGMEEDEHFELFGGYDWNP